MAGTAMNISVTTIALDLKRVIIAEGFTPIQTKMNAPLNYGKTVCTFSRIRSTGNM